MNTRKHESRRQRFALAPLALALAWVGAANAAEYWLCAKSTSLTMPAPDSQVIPMWGFALDSTGFAGNCAAAASVPGPALIVPPGVSLTIHLRNALTGLGVEPVSIVIPGQALPTTPAGGALDPVKFPDGNGRQRVRSFTAEASAGVDQTYTWNTLKPGTYLYHSGTHPQVQVQMGLYGALEHDAAAGHAYPGKAYSADVTLLFSEIDPVLHTAVTTGNYGPTGTMTSTIDYVPSYFLVNGAPYTVGSPALVAGSAGQPTLLRLINAGLKSRSPLLQGMHMQLIAEDGNPYPYAREQYSTLLPALKTIDAFITPSAAATYAFYDRRLALSNPGAAGAGPGGMLAFLEVGDAPGGTPTADNDAYATNEDTPLNVAAPGVLDGDSAGTTASLLSGTGHGSLSLAADGSFTYTPQANYSGADSFTYQAMSGGLASVPATVSLTVNPVNDPPAATGESYSLPAGTTLNVAAPGVLGNDSDVDGDPLMAVNASALAGLTFNADGSFTYNATAAGVYSFTYQASDGLATSPAATVGITVIANQPPLAVDDTASAPRRATATYTPVVIDVLANDSDPDGNLLPATVDIVVGPNKGGTVSVNPDGTVSYTPALYFRGSENFTYQVRDSLGATVYTSSKSTSDSRATVKVNVK